MQSAKQNRVGERYGRLLVVKRADRSTSKRTYWDCVCDCGGTISPRSDALTAGRAKSCGCLQREVAASLGEASRKHNYKGTKVYNSWSHMKGRCQDENDPRWKDYGGRGIRVCDRWQNFANFLEDMGEPPSGMTLERKNPNGNYEPDNCVWATWLEQNRNRTISVRVVTDAGLLPIKDYASEEGISYDAARARAYRGKVPTVRVGELA
jgi:hypothetical protein